MGSMMRVVFLFHVISLILFQNSRAIAQSASSLPASTGAPQGRMTDKIDLQTSPWGFNFWGVAIASKPKAFDLRTKAYGEGDTKTFSYSYLSLNYKLNSEERVSLRTPFLYMSVGYGENKYVPLDMFISYSRSSVGELGDAKISTGARLYLPTSQQAFDSKMLMGFRAEVAAKLKTENWKWGYYFKPDFYLYEQNEFLDSARGNRLSSSKMLKLEHYIEGERAFNRVFALRPYLGFEDNWYNTADKKTKSNLKTDLIARLGLDINLSRKLGFSLGVENKTSVTFRDKDWVPFSPEDNSLFLVTYAEI